MTAYPKLAIQFDGERVVCGRPGCHQALGWAVEWGVLLKPPRPRTIWWYAYPMVKEPITGEPQFTFRVMRRRHEVEHPAGPVNEHGAHASPGNILECPRCRTWQFVPNVDNGPPRGATLDKQ